MTTMEVEDLIGIGFNKNEAKVYFSLIKFGKTDAHQLIQNTKFHKNIVYDNLDKLIEKGLVTYVIENGRRVYKMASSEILVEFFEEQEKELKTKKDKAKNLAKEIDTLKKDFPIEQEATIYKGIKGLKSFYNQTLHKGDFLVFGSPKESVEIMGETFWRNYDIKRKEKRISAKLIFNSSLRWWGETIKNKYTDVRYFDKDFEPLTETNIQGDEVGIIVWTEEPILFLIQDKNVAESYRKFFEGMWKVSKK